MRGSLHSLEKITPKTQVRVTIFVTCSFKWKKPVGEKSDPRLTTQSFWVLFLEITIILLYAHFPFVTRNVEKMYSRFNKIYNFVALSTAKSAFSSFLVLSWHSGRQKERGWDCWCSCEPRLGSYLGASSSTRCCSVSSVQISQVKMAKNNSVVSWTSFLPCRSPGRVLETPRDLWTRPGEWIRKN